MHRTSNAVSNLATYPAAFRRSFLLACCFTLFLVGMITQQAHGLGVPVPRYAYVLDQLGDSIDMFSINLNTGVLVRVVGCAANPMPLAPLGIAGPSSGQIDPTGSFLFISDFVGNQVAGFDILPNGCLAFINRLPTGGLTPDALGISSSGEYLYVADTCGGAGCVEGFQIMPTGALVPIAGPVPAGPIQAGLAVDPVRQYIFASDLVGIINSSTFNPATGIINLPWLANPAVRPNPFRMKLDPVGGGAAAGGPTLQYLLALSNGPAFLDCYLVSTGNGAIAPVGNAPTGLNPHSVALTPLGQFAYVTNFGGGTVQAYNINTCNNIAVDGAAVNLGAGSNPEGLTVDQTGRFVYVAANGPGQVWGFRINLLNGTLVKVGAWATAPGPVHIATMP
jgi:DNA-binding beta-propeller fold protein YncE